MTEQPEPTMSTEVTSDDKLWALLAYIFSPIVPVILLLMEDKKNRPFIRAHNAQALVLGIIEVILSAVIGWTFVGLCVPLALWIVMIYWGVQAYQGKEVTVPVITNFVRNQGWA